MRETDGTTKAESALKMKEEGHKPRNVRRLSKTDKARKLSPRVSRRNAALLTFSF